MRPRDPISPIAREMRRDEQLVAGNLLRGVGRILLDVLDTLLLDPERLELPPLQDQLGALLQASQRHHRELNDRRIARRGERPQASGQPPEPARPYRHHGDYIGAFPSMQAVAAHALDLRGLTATQLARLDLTGVAIDLHLDGVLWTIDLDGELHTFRPRPPITPNL